MKFLFHAATFEKGKFTYWNIYLISKSTVLCEDLNRCSHNIQFDVSPILSELSVKMIKKKELMVCTVMECLEEYLEKEILP